MVVFQTKTFKSESIPSQKIWSTDDLFSYTQIIRKLIFISLDQQAYSFVMPITIGCSGGEYLTKNVIVAYTPIWCLVGLLDNFYFWCKTPLCHKAQIEQNITLSQWFLHRAGEALHQEVGGHGPLADGTSSFAMCMSKSWSHQTRTPQHLICGLKCCPLKL